MGQISDQVVMNRSCWILFNPLSPNEFDLSLKAVKRNALANLCVPFQSELDWF
jgi:hypothetical protein